MFLPHLSKQKTLSQLFLVVCFIIFCGTLFAFSKLNLYLPFVTPVSEVEATPGKLFQAVVKHPTTLSKPFVLTQSSGDMKCTIPIVGVTTTFKSSSTCVDQTAMLMPVVVVGDTGSDPVGFQTAADRAHPVEFLSLDRQTELFPNLDAILPTESFARKNMGYLRAIQICLGLR
jgi:hypothetical protein